MGENKSIPSTLQDIPYVFSDFILEGYFCRFNDSFDSNYPVQAQKQNCHNDEIILTLVINQPWT